MAHGFFTVVRGLLSTYGMWVLQFVALGLRCPMACGISVPQPGIEPTSPALEGRFLTPGPPGMALRQCLVHFFFYWGREHRCRLHDFGFKQVGLGFKFRFYHIWTM